MTETRAEKKQRTRQRILEAALALMSQGRSLDSLGLREVARSAGLAATSLYNHFADMDALGLALIDEACFRLRSGMGQGRRALIEEDPAAGLEDLVDRFINYLDQHEAEFRLLMKQRLGNSSLFRRRIQRELELLVEELAEDVRRAGERRGLPPMDYARAAEAAVAVMFGFGAVALDLPSRARRQARERVSVQLSMVFLGGRALAAGLRPGDAVTGKN